MKVIGHKAGKKKNNYNCDGIFGEMIYIFMNHFFFFSFYVRYGCNAESLKVYILDLMHPDECCSFQSEVTSFQCPLLKISLEFFCESCLWNLSTHSCILVFVYFIVMSYFYITFITKYVLLPPLPREPSFITQNKKGGKKKFNTTLQHVKQVW